jgi:hypothetical protein
VAAWLQFEVPSSTHNLDHVRTELEPPQNSGRFMARLRRIQHHRITLNDSQPAAGLSTIDQEQASILAALTIK